MLRIARLAVDQRATGSGIGLSLLHAVFVVAHRMASHVGCAGVLVDAKPDAVTFFERFGFIPLQVRVGALGERPEPAVKFLSLKDVPAPEGDAVN